MKILLAEDDHHLGKILEHMLKKKEGHSVEWYTSGSEAYKYALTSHYDVLILDWMLPELDRITVCQMLRQYGYAGAILMLTPRDNVLDRVKGLDSGADDYLTKPFEFEEDWDFLYWKRYYLFEKYVFPFFTFPYWNIICFFLHRSYSWTSYDKASDATNHKILYFTIRVYC